MRGYISIQLDEQTYNKSELIKSNEKAKLKNLLATEIPTVISASLHDKPEVLLKSILPGESYSKNRKIRDEFDHKIKYVKDTFITSSLRHRSILRAISKNDILGSLKWDIGTKYHDYEEGKLQRFPFATISFQINPFFDESPFFPAYPPKEKNFIVDMHVDEIKQLIDELSVVVDNLEKIDSQEGHEKNN